MYAEDTSLGCNGIHNFQDTLFGVFLLPVEERGKLKMLNFVEAIFLVDMFQKKNLLIIGLLLLLIFAVAVWLVGVGIDRTARKIQDNMLEEVGRYRAGLIALDFNRTIELSGSIKDYLQENSDNEKSLQDLLRGLVRMDNKITRIWYRHKSKHFVYIDTLGIQAEDRVLETTLEKITRGVSNKRKSCLYYCDGLLYWTSFLHFGNTVVGLDVSLQGLHAYFAGMTPGVRSYVYILNKEGMIITHPDELRIGRHLSDSVSRRQFQETVNFDRIVRGTGFSQYLLVPVKRVYYPIKVGEEKWAVVVNMPELVLKEEMSAFHRYTFFIVVFTVLLFSLLLIMSQYKWRKEYDRRRKLEQETMQLNLQQLKNQINPHFLFNSLNSLSALIGSEPEVAREFVLNLSRIYRYVLEKRNESLVTVHDETEFIRYYYFLQKIRFRDQLNLDMEEGIGREERKIPVMSLQLLIENAIKHNEITRQHPLSIRIYRKEDTLVVENVYRPRSDSSESSLGVGFENIRKIYAYCSDKQFEYRIQDGRFICILPLLAP